MTPLHRPRILSWRMTLPTVYMIPRWLCSSTAGDWIRVLTRSRGCSNTVEQVPLKEPATNDLKMGELNNSIFFQSPDVIWSTNEALLLICCARVHFWSGENVKATSRGENMKEVVGTLLRRMTTKIQKYIQDPTKFRQFSRSSFAVTAGKTTPVCRRSHGGDRCNSCRPLSTA